MKIRNGFVSNSSSSSFIIVGVKVLDCDMQDVFGDDHADIYDGNKKLLNTCSVLDDETYIYVGHVLAISEYLEENQFTIDKLIEHKKEVFDVLKKYNINSDDVRLYMGTLY